MEIFHYCFIIFAFLSIVIFICACLYIYIDHTWRPGTPKTRLRTTHIKDILYYRAEFYRPVIGWKGFNAYLCTGQIIRDNTWYARPSICNKSIKAYSQIIDGSYAESDCPGQN